MAESRKEKVDRILQVIPPYGSSLTSDGTAEKFQKVTNWTHQGLLDQWKKEEANYQEDLKKEKAGGPKAVKHVTTTCNAFTGWYGTQLGSKKYVGRFDLEQVFPHAWVPADPNGERRPNYGDICRFRRYHVGVSLDFDGDTWNSVEGGQGGPSSGRDIVTRKRTPYTGKLLQGWIDISKLEGVDLAPDGGGSGELGWLLGWWVVRWRGKPFFYLFEPQGRVKFSRTPPMSSQDPLLRPIDTGTYSVHMNVTITWKATQSVEVLRRSLTDHQMSGTWNGTVPLQATKLK